MPRKDRPLWVDKEIAQEVKVQASKRGISIKDYVTQAVKEKMKREEKKIQEEGTEID